MAAKGPTNVAEVKRIQVSLDSLSYKLLGKIASYGMDGRSHAEVASRIIRDWLKDNAIGRVEKVEALEKLVETD